jgi:hypothetical protein
MWPHDVYLESLKHPHMKMTEAGLRKLMPEMLRSRVIRNDLDGYYHRDSLKAKDGASKREIADCEKELDDAPRKELDGHARKFFDDYQHQRHIEPQVVIAVIRDLLSGYEAKDLRRLPQRRGR